MGEANQEIGRGCLSTIGGVLLIRLISIAVVAVVGAIALLFGIVVGTFTEAVWGIVAAGSLFFLVIFVGGYLFLIGAVFRRKWKLDRAFVPLGLRGSIYRLMFRRYGGTINGRAAEAYFYRGPNLEIFLSTPLKARAGITLDYADTEFAAGLFGKIPVDHGLEALRDVRIWSDDDVWARQMVMDPRVQEDLRTLLSDRDFFVRSIVKVFPGYVQLHLSGNRNILKWEITPESAVRWVGTLALFAEHLETRVPKPKVPFEISSAEELALSIKRKDTTRITIYFVAGLLAFFFIATVLTLVVVAVIANL